MNDQPYLKVMNDVEKMSLERLSQDQTTLLALKKLFLYPIYYSGVLRPGEDPDTLRNFVLTLTGRDKMTGEDNNMKLSNERLGELTRSKIEGIFSLELGFKELEKFKPLEVSKKSTENPGK